MHIAARSNAVSIAKILKHVYIDMKSNRTSKFLKPKSPPEEGKLQLPSDEDDSLFFDLNRTNLLGQSPIFLTMQQMSVQMLKFLMKNKCSITMKEGKGDTVREHILRNTFKSTEMLDAYMKYEDMMIIERIIEPVLNRLDGKWSQFFKYAKSYFRWNSPRFIRLFIKVSYQKIMAEYHCQILGGLLGHLYLLHWILYNGTKLHVILSMVLHGCLLVFGLALLIFERQEIGTVEKLTISSDQDQCVIGQLQHLMKERQLQKIESLNERLCFDCLIIRSKNSQHCKRCDQCINFRHKHQYYILFHSKLLGKCIGAENARSYLLIMISLLLIMSTFITLSITSLPMESDVFFLKWLAGFKNLWNYSKMLFIISAILSVYLTFLIDDLLIFLTAITRNLTQREFLTIWDHKKCFDIKTPSDDGEEENRSYFVHKKVSLFQIIKNFVLFCKGDLLRKAKTSSKRVRVKRSYNDVANSSRQTSYS